MPNAVTSAKETNSANSAIKCINKGDASLWKILECRNHEDLNAFIRNQFNAPHLCELKQAPTVHDHIVVDGNTYIITLISSENQVALSEKIDLGDDHDTDNTDDMTCPHCGHVDYDAYELASDEDERNCLNCGLPYSYVRETKITYRTKKVGESYKKPIAEVPTIVYSSENGGDYTAERIRQDVRAWMKDILPFKFFDLSQQDRAVEITYPILLESLSWQCPVTLLWEWDKDDIKKILNQYETKFGKITFSKEQVIEMLAFRGYDQQSLYEDHNFFWEVVREYYEYDESNNAFVMVEME